MVFRELKRGEEAAADEKKVRELFGKLTSLGDQNWSVARYSFGC